jgi:hypothetical protein
MTAQLSARVMFEKPRKSACGNRPFAHRTLSR